MKAGSIVECVKAIYPCFEALTGQHPKIGGVYTVREVITNPADGDTLLYLDEVQNISSPDGWEYGYTAQKFRELQSPESDMAVLKNATKPAQPSMLAMLKQHMEDKRAHYTQLAETAKTGLYNATTVHGRKYWHRRYSERIAQAELCTLRIHELNYHLTALS